MGRGGRGGGGHSHSSGGSSRSSGGRHIGSSPSGRGGRTSSYSSSGSYRSSSYHHHHYYGSTYMPGYAGVRATVLCFTVLLFIVVFAVIILGAGSNVRKSTVEREYMKPYAAFDKDCIIDEVNWLRGNTVRNGMEQFYKKTGVQPYLLISNNINGYKNVSSSEAIDYLDGVYTQLAGDNEQAVILGFFEWYDSNVDIYYICGKAAQTVMDTEACDILCDYAEALYTSDMSDDEYFSAIWTRTANRIMRVTPTLADRIPMIVIAVVVIVVIYAAYKFFKEKNRRDHQRAEDTERILKTPIERL